MNTSFIDWQAEVRTDKGYVQLKVLYNLWKKQTKIRIATYNKTLDKIIYSPIKDMEKSDSLLYSISSMNNLGSFTCTEDQQLLMHDILSNKIDYQCISSNPFQFYPVTLNNNNKLMRIPTQDQKAVLTAFKLSYNPYPANNNTPFTPSLTTISKNFAEWVSKGLNYKLTSKIKNYDRCNFYEFDNPYGYLMGSIESNWIDSIDELAIFTFWYLNGKTSFFNVKTPIITDESKDIENLTYKFQSLGLDPVMDNNQGYSKPIFYMGNKNRMESIIDTYYDEYTDGFRYSIDNTVNPYTCIAVTGHTKNEELSPSYRLALEEGENFFIKLNNTDKKSNVSLIVKSH